MIIDDYPAWRPIDKVIISAVLLIMFIPVVIIAGPGAAILAVGVLSILLYERLTGKRHV